MFVCIKHLLIRKGKQSLKYRLPYHYFIKIDIILLDLTVKIFPIYQL